MWTDGLSETACPPFLGLASAKWHSVISLFQSDISDFESPRHIFVSWPRPFGHGSCPALRVPVYKWKWFPSSSAVWIGTPDTASHLHCWKWQRFGSVSPQTRNCFCHACLISCSYWSSFETCAWNSDLLLFVNKNIKQINIIGRSWKNKYQLWG